MHVIRNVLVDTICGIDSYLDIKYIYLLLPDTVMTFSE